MSFSLRIKQLATYLKAAMTALILFCALAGSAHAQISASSQVELTDKTSSVAVGRNLYITPDPQGQLGYKAVVTRHENNIRGERRESDIINLGLGPVPVWMILSVDNQSQVGDWVLHFGQIFEGRYASVKKLLVVNQSTGQTFTRALREKNIRGAFGEDLNGPALFIKLRPNQTDTLVIYVEADGGAPATLAPRLITARKYIQNLRFGDIPTLLGGIFFVSVIGFFVAILYMERRPSYLLFLVYYFLLTALFSLLGSLFFSGFSLMGESLALLYVAAIGVGLPMTRYFLELAPENHREKSMLAGGAVLLGVTSAFALSFFDDDMVLNQLLFLVPPFVAVLTILFVSFIQVQQNKYGALYYALGWTSLFCGMLLSGLSFGSGTPSKLLVNAFWLSLLPQAAFFVLATTKKIQMMDEEFRQEKIRESRMARSLARLKQSKESADQARLLRVIERERELMSELREREMQRTEEMRRAKEVADQANRAKSAFLAVVTHEIRTPMTGIMGMVRLLLDTKLSTKQNEYALAIQKSGDTMIALLNDILDFEKSKGGKMELEKVDFDLLRLVQDVVLLMSGRTAEKNIYLKSDIDPSVPRYVRGDPARLRQILLNLVTNAIKFTAEGGVTIRLRATKQEGAHYGEYEVYFGIEDTGIGIPENMQENLFVPFMQADSSVNRKYGGTGLGLAIVKKLVEAMGGAIAVNSQVNAGSTFFFSILMEEGTAEAAALTDAPKSQNILQSNVPAKDILVVEDNEMNRRVLQGLLEKHGHRIDLAKSGEEAVEKAARKRYDLILMDIELPGMSGEETTRVLRRHPDRAVASTPVIALTGHVMLEDIERFYEANMNGHLAKPIQPEQLLDAIKRVHAGDLENPLALPEGGQEHDPSPAPAEEGGITPMQRFLRARQKEQTKIEDELDVDSFEEATRAFEKEKTPAVHNEDGLLDMDMLDGLLSTLGKEQMQDLLHGFFETCDRIVGSIEMMTQNGQTDELQARAHELKGMAANFGVAALGDAAGKVEKFMRDGKNEAALDEARKLFGLASRSREAVQTWLKTA